MPRAAAGVTSLPSCSATLQFFSKLLKTPSDVYEHENASVGESLRQPYKFSGGRCIKAGKQTPVGAEVEAAAAIVAAVRC